MLFLFLPGQLQSLETKRYAVAFWTQYGTKCAIIKGHWRLIRLKRSWESWRRRHWPTSIIFWMGSLLKLSRVSSGSLFREVCHSHHAGKILKANWKKHFQDHNFTSVFRSGELEKLSVSEFFENFRGDVQRNAPDTLRVWYKSAFNS